MKALPYIVGAALILAAFLLGRSSAPVVPCPEPLNIDSLQYIAKGRELMAKEQGDKVARMKAALDSLSRIKPRTHEEVIRTLDGAAVDSLVRILERPIAPSR